MPIGTGAVQAANLPSEHFQISPDEFNAMTRKNEHVVAQQDVPAGSFVGFSWPKQLPQTGIIGRLRIVFEGLMTIDTGGATASNRWPYGVLDKFALSANGQNNLWSCDGLDLNALAFLRNPAYTEHVDSFAGSVGGGAIAAVTDSPLYLTWDVPIAMDDTSLVGALYLQSGATSIAYELNTPSAMARLFSANDSRVSIAGEFKVSVTRFSVPRSAAEGNPLVIPDLTRLHAFNAVDLPLTNVGDVRLPMVRSAGQLTRLLVSANSTATNRLSALPSAASTKALDAIRLEYGAGERPIEFNPASTLLSLNNRHYGAPLPYDRLALDFVRENAPRDIVQLQGVTDLVTILTVGSGVTPGAGTARLVQETLF